jgi:hypothetical protein
LNRSCERSASVALVAIAMLFAPRAGEAQGLFERLNLDRLKLTAMGASYGAIQPSQMEPTQAYSLHADYGEIAERWRVVFNVTYWGSHYRENIVRGFADSLGASVEDPEGNAEVIASGVAVSDIAVGGDVRWMSPMRYVRFKPYLGGNISVHVLNAEGKLIQGTFMEQALDNIATGIAGVAGIDIVVFSHLSVGTQARYDLLSGIRYSSIRLTGSYLFDRAPLHTPSR